MENTHFAPAERATSKELKRDIDFILNNPIADELLRVSSGCLAVLNEHRQILSVNEFFLEFLEIGDAETVYHRPAHPYTRVLLSAVPQPDPHYDYSGEIKLSGEIPSMFNKPSGCAFRTRCPIVREQCAYSIPSLEPQVSGQLAACPFV